jgi:hypothetical protein
MKLFVREKYYKKMGIEYPKLIEVSLLRQNLSNFFKKSDPVKYDHHRNYGEKD